MMMAQHSKKIKKQPLLSDLTQEKSKPSKKPLFKGYFEGFTLFPLDRRDRFVGEIPEDSVDARNFFDDAISDLV